MKKTEEIVEIEETKTEKEDSFLCRNYLVARNYVRKHKLAMFTAAAATAVAIVSVKSNRALRDDLAELEAAEEDDTVIELDAPTDDDIVDAIVIDNEEIVA
jgi:hypothetical protein